MNQYGLYIAFVGMAMIIVAWLFFRKPNVKLWVTVPVWKSQNYLKPVGFYLSILGLIIGFLGLIVSYK